MQVSLSNQDRRPDFPTATHAEKDSPAATIGYCVSRDTRTTSVGSRSGVRITSGGGVAYEPGHEPYFALLAGQ